MNKVSLIPSLPNVPRSTSALLSWTLSITKAVQDLYVNIATALNNVVMSNTLAKRPTASGYLQLYLSTDGKILYVDDAGTWRVPRLETVATASLPAAAAAQDGRVVIESAVGPTLNIVVYAAGIRARVAGVVF